MQAIIRYKVVLLFVFLFCASSFSTWAQTKVIKGLIRDRHSEEAIPFVSVRFQKTGIGKLADSSGSFVLQFSSWPKDTLEVTSVGYQDFKALLNPALAHNDTLDLIINMERGKINVGVVVKAKGNRALWFLKRIVQHKKDNDRYRFDNFSYELYNKMELDLKNINKEKLADRKLFRPFNFILDNIDTSEGVPYLPSYLAESISDYYYQKSPLKRREVFKATKTVGVNNESIAKLLGGMDQVVNVYNNFIPVFDKQFVSPINDNGSDYYNYRLADTQYVAGRRLVHFYFTPKHKGQNTFEGDCWVHDTTFAIQKMNLRLSKEANINYIDQLSLIQEYQLVNDSTWFLAKDKFVVDVVPFGKSIISFIGRKTTTYRDVVINDTSVANELEKNKVLEEVILPPEATTKTDEFWAESRHEQLNKNEQGIYTMIDSLMKVPAYKKYTNTIYFLTVGYKNVGNYEIGPWYNWVTYNSLEGTRLRFDLGTNTKFSKKIYLHGYLAYGFGDEKFKYKMDALYLLQKRPRMHIAVSYTKDIDYGQSYYDGISQDNVFALAVRKSNVPIKFLKIDEKKVEFKNEWKSGLSATLATTHKIFDPLRNLPPKSYFLNGNGSEPLATAEVSLRLRYAYLEKFLESTFNRISLGSQYPIVDIKYTRGVAGVLKSTYNYHKISAGVSDYMNVAPFGNIYYNVFAGRTFGTLPYMLLDIAPGNEIYYYNQYAFNMMNRYEFIHDRYAGINIEHNIGNGIFRFTGITRKLKFRQFWTAKGLWGSLQPENKKLNFVGSYPFRSLDGKTYMEVGTGVDNILKVLRVDFIWRVLPQTTNAPNNQKFGVFGSFRLAF